MKSISFPLIFFMMFLLFLGTAVQAQGSKSVFRVEDALLKAEDSIVQQFKKLKFNWPPNAVYIRSFKYDRELELWVQNNLGEPYKLFKVYKVCMQSGSMGPKRMEGDYQVPEGFYHINDFNTNSSFHLSLGLSYPNASDKILSDSFMPGTDIYIHGNCVSTGCIPISDEPIEEVFTIANKMNIVGQEFIPVHVFPGRFNVKKTQDYINEQLKKNPVLAPFTNNIKSVFDFFETKKQIPIILVNKSGEYILN